MSNMGLSLKVEKELQDLVNNSEESEKFLFYSMTEASDELFAKLIKALPKSCFKKDVFKDVFRGYYAFFKKYERKPEKFEVAAFMINMTGLESSQEDVQSLLAEMEKWFFSDTAKEFQKDFLIMYLSRLKLTTIVEDIVTDYQQKGKVNFKHVQDNIEELGEYKSLFNSVSDACLSDVEGFIDSKKEEFGTSGVITTIESIVSDVNNIMQYKGISAGSLNVISAAPGRGKTQFLIQQGVSAATEGKTVLHVFLGDLQKYTASLRYLSCFTNKSMNEISFFSGDQIKKLFARYAITGAFDNIHILCFPPEDKTATELINVITKLQEKRGPGFHYDLVMIDYDEGIKTDENPKGWGTSNMYHEGGDTYNKLKKFATDNKSVVFVASQPKVSYYNAEILTLDALAESSKKQKIADTIFTIGSNSIKSNVKTLYICKNRLGAPNRLFYIETIGETQRVHQITEAEYDARKNGD